MAAQRIVRPVIRRLGKGDRDLARRVFTLMAEVFGESSAPLPDGYLDRLLERDDFWAFAALDGSTVAGGLTAHTLPMTRHVWPELFIYDVAVSQQYQGQGVGRALMLAVRQEAAMKGISDLFVPADTADAHAVDFYRALGGTAAAVTMFTFSPLETPVDAESGEASAAST